MDAVGEVLAERQQSDLPWGFGTSMAVILHAGIGAILVISALHRPVRLITPRAVNVRLVQAGTLRGGPPAPVAVPEKPVPEKPKIIKPAEEQPPPPSEKAKLLPAKEKEK